MTKRPNKLGRIESETKVRWYKKTNWRVIGKTVLAVGLVALGVLGTLQYQKIINNIKAEGVAEYKLTCEKFTDKDKKVTWLECDE
uniref:Uncharacterized protein n=1 Tax=Podoviridae sp. ctU557 TaxID=2827736 RepID=A0A8S5T8S5_9CAUD|nr:MAG TPA: hypothetical protein [Podoviridae sp. ctU557]